MFELSVACKYLLPRRRQLSVSIISLISVLVISLVVWLIVVFFSVTDGLEKSWIHKLTALTAPVRITPTDAYYNSYYYQIDSICHDCDYSLKTINEKKIASVTDPYNPQSDEEIPLTWPTPDKDASGNVKDLVKLAYASLETLPFTDLKADDFEFTASQMRLYKSREPGASTIKQGNSQSYLTYQTYLSNFEPNNANLSKILLPIEQNDINNLFTLLGASYELSDDQLEQPTFLASNLLQERLANFFNNVTITHLKIKNSGWMIPRQLLPKQTSWQAYAVFKGPILLRVLIPSVAKDSTFVDLFREENPDLTVTPVELKIDQQISILLPNQEPKILQKKAPLVVVGDLQFPVKLRDASIKTAKKIEEIEFDGSFNIQNSLIESKIPFRGLEIAHFAFSFIEKPSLTQIVCPTVKEGKIEFSLPQDSINGDGILLPKAFKEAGILVGDCGFLNYFATTASSIQEQRLPIYVAGFYDPGIIPLGAKFVLANRDIVQTIRSSHNQNDRIPTNGINVRFSNFQQADQVKLKLIEDFKKKGINRYWNIETYREYDFTKEIMRELQSQKNIFTVIAVVIIIVACSNIISMLIILVNDKKAEIGILRSMGASSKSIALIFGLSGALIGLVGSAIGVLTAVVTLKNLQSLLLIISKMQGYDLFNSAFYGEAAPQEISLEALSFVLIATVIISILAGIVPAVKACLLRPSTILRSTG